MLDTTRHREIIDPSRVTTPIHLIGCGAVGSWTALQLIKLGLRTVHVWDGDKVAEHNISNQAFYQTSWANLRLLLLKRLQMN